MIPLLQERQLVGHSFVVHPPSSQQLLLELIPAHSPPHPCFHWQQFPSVVLLLAPPCCLQPHGHFYESNHKLDPPALEHSSAQLQQS